jgi:hypothetical protein
VEYSGVIWWGIVIAGSSPIWGAFLWEVYEFRIRPLFIPCEEIDRLVEQMMRRDDPEQAALIEEHAAWYRSDSFEQGKWRRVRCRLGKER